MSYFAKFNNQTPNAEIIMIETLNGVKVVKAVALGNTAYPIMDTEELTEFHKLLNAPGYFKSGHLCPMILQKDEEQLGGALVSAAWFSLKDVNSAEFKVRHINNISLDDGTVSVSMKMWARELSNDSDVWRHKTCMDMEYEIAHRIMTGIMLGEENPAKVANQIRDKIKKLLND